jgi:hypothetical protein
MRIYVILSKQLKMKLMKTFNFTRFGIPFISGLIVGAAIVGIVWYSTAAPVPYSLPQGGTVTVERARALVQSYFTRIPDNDPKVKGFVIGIDQYNAMTALLTKNPTLGGFRVFMGTDESGKNVALVLGMDKTLRNDYTLIYSTNWVKVGPCPPDCETPNPISD